MLKTILCNFSEDELQGFLPNGALEFSSELYSEEKVNNKSIIAHIVANSVGVDFVFNEKYRELLIERLAPSIFVELFPEFNISINTLTFKHYEAVSTWAKEDLDKFADKIGLLEEYSEAIKVDSTLESICSIEPAYSLYPYQKKISDKVFSSLKKGDKRVLIHLPTGAGKTRTAMNIAVEHLRASPRNLILWLADREELCEQAFSEFKNAWGNCGDRACTAYGFYSNSSESLGGIDSGFVVAGLQKLLSIKNKDSKKLKILYRELRENVTMVIFDEAHKSVANTYSEIVHDFVEDDKFKADFIGLTATPGRQYSALGVSDEDRRLSEFFFNNKVSMDIPGYLSPIDYLVENQYLAEAEFLSLNYDHSEIAGFELKDVNISETNKSLANNTERNKRIVEVVMKECKNGSQVIIFACTVKHAQNLAVALNYLGISAASIDSKLDTPESRRSKIQRYKNNQLQVLTNYGVLTAGFDAPRTNVALIAKPTNSLVEYLQMAGRAMRGFKSGGNKVCRIYTVVDDIPEFKSVHMAFEFWNDMWVTEGDE